MVSVFAADRACGVTLQGLKFPLDNACLTSTVPLGVSNAFTGAESVMWNEDARSFVNRIRKICDEDTSV